MNSSIYTATWLWYVHCDKRLLIAVLLTNKAVTRTSTRRLLDGTCLFFHAVEGGGGPHCSSARAANGLHQSLVEMLPWFLEHLTRPSCVVLRHYSNGLPLQIVTLGYILIFFFSPDNWMMWPRTPCRNHRDGTWCKYLIVLNNWKWWDYNNNTYTINCI